MNSNGIGRVAMRFCFAFGLWAAALGFALEGCTSGHGLVAGLGKVDAGTGAPGGGSSGTDESTAEAGSTGSLADAGVAGGSGGTGDVGASSKGGGGGAGSSAGGASSGGSVAVSSPAPDAGAVDSRPRDFTRLIGKYKVTSMTGGLACDGTGSSILFKDEPMTVERGSDANLIATTNLMPGEYPAPCTVKINAKDHPESGMLMAPQDTICTSGGVTLALTAYIFANNVSDTKIGITATGTVTGGPNGKCDFGYGAEAVPVP